MKLIFIINHVKNVIFIKKKDNLLLLTIFTMCDIHYLNLENNIINMIESNKYRGDYILYFNKIKTQLLNELNIDIDISKIFCYF